MKKMSKAGCKSSTSKAAMAAGGMSKPTQMKTTARHSMSKSGGSGYGSKGRK